MGKGNAKQTDQSLLNVMPLAFELMSKDRCPFTIFYNGDGQNNAETNLTPGQQGRARLHDTQTCITVRWPLQLVPSKVKRHSNPVQLFANKIHFRTNSVSDSQPFG